MKKILFALIVLGLFLIACSAEEPAAPEVEDDTPEDTAQMPVPDTDTPEMEVDEDTGAAEPESGVLEELTEFFSKKGSLEYMVEYDLVTTTDGATSSSEMTMYLDGPSRIRTDATTEGVEARTYMVDETVTSCSNDGNWRCFQMEYTVSESNQVMQEVEENPAEYDISPLPPKSVAGVLAACFRITTEDATVDYCFSDEGVPLFVKTEGSSGDTTFSSEMTATSYSTDVPGNAFDLPAEPMDMGNMEDILAQYS